MTYIVKRDAHEHTCWDDPDWDGCLTDNCNGCDEAADHPCEFCGYGHVFTTHNPEAHDENGDAQVPDFTNTDNDVWCNSPHLR